LTLEQSPEQLKSDQEKLKEEVRAGLSPEERAKFDEVMLTKSQLLAYMATHMGELKEEFDIVKEKCNINFSRSVVSIRENRPPVCRFCPAWNSLTLTCWVREHLVKIKKEHA
jgi:hypothetical protein